MGTASRAPRRTRAKNIFLDKSKIEARARAEFPDEAVVEAALELADTIGAFAAEDELTDAAYVDALTNVILTVAPHTALMRAFQEFETIPGDQPVDLDRMQRLLGKTRVAELASYGQIAHERVRVIDNLEKIVTNQAPEPEFQALIASAPWLVEPTWSIISENESLNTFKTTFELWYEQQYKEKIELQIRHGTKRPDFTLVDVGHRLYIVEIKPSGHVFDDDDAERLLNYAYAFSEFFNDHPSIKAIFSQGYQIMLVADDVAIDRANNRISYESLVAAGLLRRLPWTDFLARAKLSHEQFLSLSRRIREQHGDTGS